jgi:hypothetical protein
MQDPQWIHLMQIGYGVELMPPQSRSILILGEQKYLVDNRLLGQ